MLSNAPDLETSPPDDDGLVERQRRTALLKTEALRSAIVASTSLLSIATDERGVIRIFNVGAEHMLGYPASEVQDRLTPADIADPDELAERAATVSRELATPIPPGVEALVCKAARGVEDVYELTYVRRDGGRIPTIVSVMALRDPQGVVIGYLLIGSDNTARKEVEAEQRRLQHRLGDQQFYTRSLFESNIDALVTTDPSGIITDANAQMEALTGCTRDELIGTPFRGCFTDTDRASALIGLMLSQKKVIDYELTARARGGREVVVSFNATTFYDRDGRLQGVFAAARDVTRRKQLDQALAEKHRELEKANLAKSEFLSAMSHELRSPLNAILGFAQLMDTDYPPPEPPQKESIGQILRAGWHLLKLIDEVLDLAKIESQQVPLSMEPVPLAEVLRECQGMIEPQSLQRDIHMSFTAIDKECFVMADRTRVKQVVLNLLSNAIKYNVRHGSVEVACARLASPTGGGRVRVSIRDTGPGLSPEQQAHLFQAFNRLGQEAGKEEGTGIGLVVAKRLVERMGGAIGVESTVGQGSVFWFDLGATSPVVARSAAVSAEFQLPRSARPRTLLYVEDNPANLALVEQLIRRRPDIHLLSASNGRSGMAMARASAPDVILMDISLPEINGFEVLKLLRADPTTASIPVVAISANAMPRDVEAGLAAGFLRYITKPIQIKRFMEAIDEAMACAQQLATENDTVNGELPAVSPSPRPAGSASWT